MNKAITDGLLLMPPPFRDGLQVWSDEDGRPGDDTLANKGHAAFVPADQDFGGCLELLKVEPVQRLRHMGETPILPGTYLRVRARVKALSGALPRVRIAGWAGRAGGVPLGGVGVTGPEVALTAYGEVVTVEAIVGTGVRGGVDLIWPGAVFGHFGLDLVGPVGAQVRIEDLEIEDVTGVFLRDMIDAEDVRDHGARGDGSTDDSAAFQAADAAAQASRRALLVPAGTYRLETDVTLASEVRFRGRVTMPRDRRLTLLRRFDLDQYVDAFGDERIALEKAIQVLLSFADHGVLDLNGRRVQIDRPVDVAAAVGDRTSFAVPRAIRNGVIEAADTPHWTSETLTARADYDGAADKLTLREVRNVGAIRVGARVTGPGVGREVYVRAVNVATRTVTLTLPLWGAAARQDYTFTRDAYLLDFSGFESLTHLTLDGLQLQCHGRASGVMLARGGINMRIQDCNVTKPKDRAITSPGKGCQGLKVDRCGFESNEARIDAQDRRSVVLNVNANDAKLRENRVVLFAAFAVLHGSGHLITGNHFFHGDGNLGAPRQPGLILTSANPKVAITGNYIDNTTVQLTNEHDESPDFASQWSFGGLTVTGNIFTAIGAAPWFRWIEVKPFGTGHYLQGLSVTGNAFRAIKGTVDRIDGVDESHAPLRMERARNVVVQGNTFNGVGQPVANPATLTFERRGADARWACGFGGVLPFAGRVRSVEALVAAGPIRTAGGGILWTMPYAEVGRGPRGDEVWVHWSEKARGRLTATARMDAPL